MSYTAPFIDSAGLHLPSFQDVEDYLNTNYSTIYGQSVTSDISTSDIQWNANLALLVKDAYSALQFAMNGMGPATAVSTQQDMLYELCGIDRLPASYSTCQVTVTGTAGTLIAAGIVLDQNGNTWSLPTNVTIPIGGAITVTATCTTLGAISANVNTLTTIANPQQGWTGATNPSSAVPGQAAEKDSNFRARQAISTALPSRTLVSGTLAGIAATTGVTRYNNGSQTVNGASPIENPTGSTDVFGNPAHSISMVVEGGTDLAVATAIYLNKTPGALTNGTTSVAVTDPTTGGIINIGFFRPSYQNIYVTLAIHPLVGYTTATTASIQAAVVAYLASLQIGESLPISSLYGAALSVQPNPAVPQFSIKAMYANTSVTGIGLFTLGASGGTGYTVGDVLGVAGGTGGQVKVTSISGGGSTGPATGLALVVPGSGYSVATNAATTGGTGTGCQVNITAIGPNASSDIAIAFNQVVSGLLANVFVNLV